MSRFPPDSVVLRPLRPPDVTPAYVAWLNDTEVNWYLEVRHEVPVTLRQVRQFVQRRIKDGLPHWGIFVQSQHVGLVSCSERSERYGWIDVSIVVGEPLYRGVGLGKLALAGAVETLFRDDSKLHRVQAGAYANNLPCIQLFQSLGFQKEAVLRESVVVNGQYVDTVKLGILRDEWAQMSSVMPKARMVRV